AHERRAGEDLIGQYLRISSSGVPDLRPEGIPDAVCATIERAMALDPADRPASAAGLGRELQAAQRRNGLKPDSMAITSTGIPTARTAGTSVDAAGPPSAPSTPSEQPAPTTVPLPTPPTAHRTGGNSSVRPNIPRPPMPPPPPTGQQQSPGS